MKRLMLSASFLVILVVGSLLGQLQQSGGPGSTVTLQTGSNLAGKFGIDQTTPGTTNAISEAYIGSTAIASGNGVVGAGVQRVAIASDNTAFSVNATVSAALPAGTNVIGHVINDSGLINTVPKTSCGNTLASGSALAAVPTSSTLLTSAATACIVAAIFNNTNATPVTVTLTDNTGTPINALLTFSIPGGSSLIEPLYGTAFNLGVKWSASATLVTGSVVAYQ